MHLNFSYDQGIKNIVITAEFTYFAKLIFWAFVLFYFSLPRYVRRLTIVLDVFSTRDSKEGFNRKMLVDSKGCHQI